MQVAGLSLAAVFISVRKVSDWLVEYHRMNVRIRSKKAVPWETNVLWPVKGGLLWLSGSWQSSTHSANAETGVSGRKFESCWAVRKMVSSVHPPYLQVLGFTVYLEVAAVAVCRNVKWIPVFYFDHWVSLKYKLMRKSTMPLFTDYQKSFICYLSNY